MIFLIILILRFEYYSLTDSNFEIQLVLLKQKPIILLIWVLLKLDEVPQYDLLFISTGIGNELIGTIYWKCEINTIYQAKSLASHSSKFISLC